MSGISKVSLPQTPARTTHPVDRIGARQVLSLPEIDTTLTDWRSVSVSEAV